MIITITGMPGSGKSTTADILVERLKMKRYSVGDYRREMARKRGITLYQLNKLGEKEEFTDKEADDWQKKLAREDNFIIDGRLSYYFIPNSIKIFLDVKEEVGARRIRLDNRTGEEAGDEEKILKFWKERVKSDIKRYKKYYNLNPYDKNQYDFVLDTSDITVEETVEKILEFIKNLKE